MSNNFNHDYVYSYRLPKNIKNNKNQTGVDNRIKIKSKIIFGKNKNDKGNKK